jgi:hypothetical protein
MLTIYAIALHSNFKKLQSEKLKEVEIKKIWFLLKILWINLK